MGHYSLFSILILACISLPVDGGASCSCNCNGGDSGTCNNTPLITSKRSIKQCVFKNLNDNKDSGEITSCSFVKEKSSTALRVTFQGNLRVVGCSGGCCRRWFLTINGRECTSPATIDTQIYADGSVNRHTPGTLDGFCENIPKGKVTVGVSIAACSSPNKGDGYTGWESVSRLIIEEVSPLQ